MKTVTINWREAKDELPQENLEQYPDTFIITKESILSSGYFYKNKFYVNEIDEVVSPDEILLWTYREEFFPEGI